MTTTIAPPTPAVPPHVVALAQSFDVAAGTRQFGIAELFQKWQELRVASSGRPEFEGVSFATILDRVLDHRADPLPRGFNVLATCAAIQL